MPPWAILVLLLEVPAAKSNESMTAQFSPRLAASRTTPVPLAPPPMIKRSNSVEPSRSFSRCLLLDFISKSYLTRLSRGSPSSVVGSNSVDRIVSIRLWDYSADAISGFRLEPKNLPVIGAIDRNFDLSPKNCGLSPVAAPYCDYLNRLI